ncbi:MAG TPA: hypothetical protein VFX89_17205 [Gammaproteobacteria bacterium]|nr:hypothetical protein [Gammaproteobacteria bacterium]
MNVVIIDRANKEPVARYEIHLAGENDRPGEQRYFDDAWERAVSDRLVEVERRDRYDFQLQRPKNLYESSS